MARKRGKRSKTSARPEVVDVDKIDRGTVLTRRRLMAETLTADHLEPHQVTAGFRMRSALEEGLGASAFDMVNIGMSGGAKSTAGGWTPKDRLIEARWCLGQWRLRCAAAGIQVSIVEDFVIGISFRQIAAAVYLRRSKVREIVLQGLDLSADMFGIRRKPVSAPLQAWEATAPFQPPPDTEAAIHALPETARLANRNIRN